MANATHGTMEVVLQNYDDLMREFDLMEYNIKKKEVTAAKKGIKKLAGTVRVRGQALDSLAIEYRGRLLTPTHFAMKPKNRPARNRAYRVTAQIKKRGGRKGLGANVFIAPLGAPGTTQIPFQRKGSARLPIDVIKTVSVPQMITNENVSNQIYTRTNEEIGKRFEYNLNRIMNSNN